MSSQRSRGAEVQGCKGAKMQGSKGAGEQSRMIHSFDWKSKIQAVLRPAQGNRKSKIVNLKSKMLNVALIVMILNSLLSPIHLASASTAEHSSPLVDYRPTSIPRFFDNQEAISVLKEARNDVIEVDKSEVEPQPMMWTPRIFTLPFDFGQEPDPPRTLSALEKSPELDDTHSTEFADPPSPSASQNFIPLQQAGGSGNSVIVAQSTFDNDEDGWQDIGGNGPTHHPTGGNPGGYISSKDDNIGSLSLNWFAPEKFLGDKTASYGHIFSYDAKVTNDRPANDFEVRLSGGGIQLVYNTSDPGTNWTSYNIRLDETDIWTQDGQPATKEDFLTVLSSLTELLINGEYGDGTVETHSGMCQEL